MKITPKGLSQTQNQYQQYTVKLINDRKWSVYKNDFSLLAELELFFCLGGSNPRFTCVTVTYVLLARKRGHWIITKLFL